MRLSGRSRQQHEELEQLARTLESGPEDPDAIAQVLSQLQHALGGDDQGTESSGDAPGAPAFSQRSGQDRMSRSELSATHAAQDAALQEATRWRSEAQATRAAATAAGQRAELQHKAVQHARDNHIDGVARYQRQVEELTQRLATEARGADEARRELRALQKERESASTMGVGQGSKLSEAELDFFKQSNSKLRQELLEAEQRVTREHTAAQQQAADLEAKIVALQELNTALQQEQQQEQQRAQASAQGEHQQVLTWRHTAEQAAEVAKRMQDQTSALERRLAEATVTNKGLLAELEKQRHETAAVQQQLLDVQRTVADRAAYTTQIEVGVLTPLVRWFREQRPDAVQHRAAATAAAAPPPTLGKRSAAGAATDSSQQQQLADDYVAMAAMAFEALAERLAQVRAEAEALRLERRERAVEVEVVQRSREDELRAQVAGLQEQLAGAKRSEQAAAESLTAEQSALSSARQEVRQAAEREARLVREAGALQEELRSLRATAQWDLRAAQEMLSSEQRVLVDLAHERGRQVAAAEGEQQVAKVSHQLHEANTHVARLERELATAAAHRTELERRVDEAERRARRQMQAQEEQLGEVRAQHASEEQQLKMQLQEATEAIQREVAEREHCEERVRDLEAKLAAARTQAHQQVERLMQQTGKDRATTDRALQQRHEAAVQELRQHLTLCQAQYDEAASEARRLSHHLDDHTRQAQDRGEQLQNQLHAARDELQQRTAHSTALEATLQRLRAGMAHLTEEQQELQAREQQAVQQAEAFRAREGELTCRLDALKDMTDQLANKNDGLEGELLTQRRLLEDARRATEEKEAHIAGLDARIARLKEERGETMRQLESRLLEQQQRLRGQAEQVEQLKVNHQRDQQASEEERSVLQARVRGVTAERDDLVRRCDALAVEVGGLQDAARAMEAELEELHGALSEHRAAIAASEASAADAMRAAAAATQEREELEHVVAELEQQVADQQHYFQQEVASCESRSRAQLADAQTRFQGEMTGLQAQLQLLRAKQSRAMSYMGVVMGGGGPRAGRTAGGTPAAVAGGGGHLTGAWHPEERPDVSRYDIHER